MRFLPLIFLAVTFVTPAISNDLSLSENSPDLLTFQDMSQDLLASQALLETSTLTEGDEDLFSDSDMMDFPSSAEASGLYSDLEASCLTKDGQPLNKLRRRDGATVCSPPDSTPLEMQRLHELWGQVQNYRDRLWAPEEPEPEKPPPPLPPLIVPNLPEDPSCPSDFPNHLCCAFRGGLDPTDPPIILPGKNPVQSYIYCDMGV